MNRLGLAVIVLLALQVVSGAYVVRAQATTATPIKHVVFVMMENHSFDNVFGMYPATSVTNESSLSISITRPDDLLGLANGVSLEQVPNGTYWTANPVETAYRADWDDGKMDGFGANSGSQSLTYFGPSQFAVEWDWAEQYAIGDRYFSSCLCETNPNRLFSLTGYAADMTEDSGPPPYFPVNQSIFGELSRNGVSWGYYIDNPAVNDFPLNYFDGMNAYSSQIRSWNDFYSALQQGTLPAVSWVMPVGGGAPGISEHPEQNVAEGEDWLLGVVNGVMKSSAWNSTAIFITYDEGGGYYDHVAPPTVDGVQLGFRVPFFVISPYAKEDYVSHTVLNHASVLSFIDYNWNIRPLNGFVADSNLPLDMFDFNQSYGGGSLVRQPVLLQNGSTYPVSPQVPFTQLPYQRQGSSATDLAALGEQVYAPTDVSTTPFFQSTLFAVVVVVLLLVAAVAVAGMARSRRKNRTDR
jgi:phospholipase C